MRCQWNPGREPGLPTLLAGSAHATHNQPNALRMSRKYAQNSWQPDNHQPAQLSAIRQHEYNASVLQPSYPVLLNLASHASLSLKQPSLLRLLTRRPIGHGLLIPSSVSSPLCSRYLPLPPINEPTERAYNTYS